MKNTNKPELLCPVGGKPQFIAAVENGADAVYLGGSEFNARIYADNFNDIEFLEEAVDYAHLRNVKVYVTLNTLVNDDEIDRAVEYAKQLYIIGVDAVIVQDLGLIDKISKEIPNLKIHISTQGTVYSTEGVNFFNKNNNIDRVVLARELNLDEIQNIVNNVDKEIEVFVHGALCVCYSGQCKLSSQIGARSGNRGKCAQPCRLPYKLIDQNTNNVLKEDYYLSTKDICTIDILPKVISSGVHSLKIEGRMKSPEYVAVVTRIYRKYIDMCFENTPYVVGEKDKNELLQVFNRGNFWTGYLEGKDSNKLWCNIRPKHWGTYLGKVIEYKGKNVKIKLEQDVMIGDGIEIVNSELSGTVISFIRKGMDRVKEAKAGDIVKIGDIKGKIEKEQEVYKITSKKLNEEIKQTFNSKSFKKNDIDLKVVMKIGDKISVNVITNILGKTFEITIKDGAVCEKGINKSLTYEDVKKQFEKTGDVPFRVNNIEVEIEEGLITPISNINYVRRQMLDILSDKIIKEFKHKEKLEIKAEQENAKSIKIQDRNVNTKLSGYIQSIALLNNLDGINKLDRVYISLEDMVRYSNKILSKIDKDKICIYLPTITTIKYKEYIKENMEVIKEIKNILVTNIEHIEMFEKEDVNMYLDNSFNIFNSDALNKVCKLNIKGVNLSNELTLDKINNIRVKNDKQIEVDVYGNLQSMYSNFCMIGAAVSKREGCKMCTKARYVLKDRKDKVFPVIYNSIDCNMKILNSNKLFSKEAIEKLNGKVDYMRLYIYNENKEEREKTISIIKDILNNKKTSKTLTSNDKEQYTNGHFYKEV